MKKFVATKENYLKLKGQKVQVGRRKAVVGAYMTESRGGSWERGFRFSETEWGMLTAANGDVSLDHGKTWHPSERAAARSKGKMKLGSDGHGEFAFDAIQKINRQWEGPGYKWHR